MQGNGCRRLYSLLIGCGALLSCASEGSPAPSQPSCVPVEANCAPLFSPTFDEIHARTLTKSCVGGGSACHSTSGAKGGLAMEDREEAYAALLDGRVTGGEPGCGELIVRVRDHGQPWSMPPGRPLSNETLCSIQEWIEAGAKR